MTTRPILFAMLGVTILSGCATTRRDKPILTDKAASAIARSCHAASGKVRRMRNATLPVAEFVLPPGALAADDGGTPIVACLGERLAGYRYEYYGFGEQGATAPK